MPDLPRLWRGNEGEVKTSKEPTSTECDGTMLIEEQMLVT